MVWQTSKQEVNEAIDDVSKAANRAVKESLARRVQPPSVVNALFDQIGRLKEVVKHLPVVSDDAD